MAAVKRLQAKTIRLGALSLVLQPKHSPERYEALFRTAVAKKTSAPARADRHAVIATFLQRKDDPGWFYGLINRFVVIDKDGAWLDFESQKAASPAEVATEVSIPDRLKPGHKFIKYAFNTSAHTFVFELAGFAQPTMQKIVAGIFERAVLDSGVGGRVKVTIIQSKDALDRIFALSTLRRLKIQLETPPNPDDLGDFDEEIEEKMKKQHASKLVVQYEAERDDSLQPDETTKALAQLATSVGKVEGSGKDGNGKAKKISTANYPLVKYVRWAQRAEDIYDAIVRGAKEVVAKVREPPTPPPTPPETKAPHKDHKR